MRQPPSKAWPCAHWTLTLKADALDKAGAATVVVITLCALAYALLLGHRFGLEILYADHWRNVDILLQHPFPAALFEKQNGHHLVVPNLLHWVNLFVLKQGQTGIMWLGFGLGVLLAALVAAIAWRDAQASTAQKVMLGGLAAMTVLHASSGTTLYHSFDSTHTYLALAPLVLGLLLLNRQADRRHAADTTAGGNRGCLLLLVLLGTLSTTSFGYGVMAFPVFVLFSLLRRMPVSFTVLLGTAGLVVVLAFLLLMPDTFENPTGLSDGTADPDQPLWVWLWRILQWIGAPVAIMASNSLPLQFLDAEIAQRLGETLRYTVAPALFVPVFVYLAVLTLQGLLGRTRLSAAEATYLGIAIAMIAVGTVVILRRFTLFQVMPENIFESRFYPVSSLVWLAAVSLFYLRHAHATARPLALAARALPWLFLLLLASSTTAPAFRQALATAQLLSQDQTLRVAMNLQPSWIWQYLGVTDQAQMLRVARELKRRGIPVFDPVADRLLGTYLDAVASDSDHSHEVSVLGVSQNNLESGRSMYAKIAADIDSGDDILYILDRQRRVVGILAREPAAAETLRTPPPNTRFGGYITGYGPPFEFTWAAGDEVAGFRAGPVRLAQSEQSRARALSSRPRAQAD